MIAVGWELEKTAGSWDFFFIIIRRDFKADGIEFMEQEKHSRQGEWWASIPRPGGDGIRTSENAAGRVGDASFCRGQGRRQPCGLTVTFSQ